MLPFDVVPAPGKVLIRKDTVAEKTAGGIILGMNDKGRCVTATVISGDKKGKRVVFNPGISSTFELNGEKVTVIFEYDIIATL
jgi:co-chaperonin GroES (HSP10)